MRFLALLTWVGLAKTQKFNDDAGYISIDRGFNCLQKCGQAQNWAGFCDSCGLSNGSPGFCCHPDGRGHCSPAMIDALNPAEGYQCVIPKSFSTDNVIQTRQLAHKPDCWAKCGKKKDWSGKCGYCGPIGYCCHKDGRGNCPELLAKTVTESRMQCVVPSQSRNELNFETTKRSDCYDRRETVCKKLHEVRKDARECREYFTAPECSTGTADSSRPNCITIVTNYCEDISKSQAEEAREAAASNPLRSFGAYEKELFKFFALNFPGSLNDIFKQIESTNFDSEEGDFMKMINAVAPAYIMQQLKFADTERIQVTFAVLNELKPIWTSNKNKFAEIEFNVENFGLSDLTRAQLTNMIQRNGGSSAVITNVLNNYEELIESLSDWSLSQLGFMATMSELPLSAKRMDLLRLANSEPSTQNFAMLFDTIKSSMKSLHSNDDVSDEELDAIIDTLQNTHSSQIIWNSAVYMEVENLIADSSIWGAESNPKSTERAFVSRIPGDRYMEPKENFSERRLKDILQIAAFYNGAEVNIRNTAENVVMMFYSDVLEAGDRAVRAVSNLFGSKRIFKQIIKEFASNYESDDLTDLFDDIYESRIPTLRFGSAGDVFGQYLLTTALRHFGAHETFKVRQLMQTDQWMTLGAALNAVSELDADGSVSDQELAEAFNCNVKCDLGLTPFDPSSERVGTTPGPNDVYAGVVLDYFEHVQGSGDGTIEGPYGPLVVTFDAIDCAADSLLTLPALTTNNAREEIYNHIMQDLYLKSDHSAIDIVSALLQSDTWKHNGAFVIETILATETAMTDAGTFNAEEFNNWSFENVDWDISGKTDVDLPVEYLQGIFLGYNHVGLDVDTSATVGDLYDDIFFDASGKTKCTSSAELQTTHWTCPEGHDASIPGSEAAGCTSEIQIEDICQVYGYESWSHMNNLEGLWGYEWFSDNLAMYEPTINSSYMSELLGNVAQAIYAAGDNGAGGGAAYAGDTFATNIQKWFDENDAGNAYLISSLLNSGAYEGLDWMLTAGGFMMNDFGAAWEGDGGNNTNGTIGIFGGGGGGNNGASQNGYWALYDMIDLVNGGNGSWDHFGFEYNEGNASYANSSQGWWSDWVNSQDDWGPNSEDLWNKWGSQESYDGIRNGTMDIYGPAGPGGTAGPTTEKPIITAETVVWPIPEACIQKTYVEDINEYFTELGKSPEILSQIASVWAEADFTLSCGTAGELMEQTMRLWFEANAPDDWPTVEPCILDPVFASLTARVEMQLKVAKSWTEDIGDMTDFENLKWDWVTFDLTQDNITEEFLQENLENDEDFNDLFDKIDINEFIEDIVEISGTGEVTTTVAVTTGAATTVATTTVAETTTAAGTGDATTVAATTAVEIIAATGNPYAPDDGTGMVSGDPHVKVQSKGQPAVCFDILDVDQTILNLLSDPKTGLEVNGQIFNEGHGTTRLERIFIKSPMGVQLEIRSDFVELSFGDKIMNTAGFKEETEMGLDDMHAEILPRSTDRRKNGVIITINRNIQFHVTIKNGKASLRFEILDSSGLATSGLTGIIGQGILPHDYTVNEVGDISIGDRVIKNTELVWIEHDFCRQLLPASVESFLGHSVHDYRVSDKFSILRPKWLDVKQIVNQSPK